MTLYWMLFIALYWMLFIALYWMLFIALYWMLFMTFYIGFMELYIGCCLWHSFLGS